MKEMKIPCLSGSMPSSIPKSSQLLSSTCPAFNDFGCCIQEESLIGIQERHESALPDHSYCPSCIVNLRNLECAIHCSPNQRLYLTKEKPKLFKSSKEKFDRGERKEKLSFKICESFCDALYYSCGEVSPLPHSNQTYFDLYSKEDYLLSPAVRFCTSHLKKQGIHLEVSSFHRSIVKLMHVYVFGNHPHLSYRLFPSRKSTPHFVTMI